MIQIPALFLDGEGFAYISAKIGGPIVPRFRVPTALTSEIETILGILAGPTLPFLNERKLAILRSENLGVSSPLKKIEVTHIQLVNPVEKLL